MSPVLRYHWEGLGPEHQHGDDPPERHGVVELVASKEAAPDTPEGTAHFMLAISLDRALGSASAQRRLVDFVERLSGLPVREGATPTRYPGKRRWELRAQRLRDGVPLSPGDFDLLMAVSGGADRDGD